MTPYIGFFACTGLAIASFLALVALGFRDGDLWSDAVVRVRLMRGARSEHPEQACEPMRPALYAELAVDNQSDSPVMVSARVRRASALTMLFDGPHARRTALVHRRGLDGVELLGAVDGRASQRFLVPVEHRGARTLRVTAVVDQVARRTRVITTTVRVSRALDGVLPGAAVPEPRP